MSPALSHIGLKKHEHKDEVLFAAWQVSGLAVRGCHTFCCCISIAKQTCASSAAFATRSLLLLLLSSRLATHPSNDGQPSCRAKTTESKASGNYSSRRGRASTGSGCTLSRIRWTCAYYINNIWIWETRLFFHDKTFSFTAAACENSSDPLLTNFSFLLLFFFSMWTCGAVHLRNAKLWLWVLGQVSRRRSAILLSAACIVFNSFYNLFFAYNRRYSIPL